MKQKSVFLFFILLPWALVATSFAEATLPWPSLPQGSSVPSPVPFSFQYGGKTSAELLPGWTQTQKTSPGDGGQVREITYTDPATRLRVNATIRTFADFNAVEWVLTLTNEGLADTPIIEEIQPLDWTMGVSGGLVLYHASGSHSSFDDFQGSVTHLGRCGDLDTQTVAERCALESQRAKPRHLHSFELKSFAGRSSDGDLPFFNLREGYDQGVIGAIGWTGNWKAGFNWDLERKTVTMTAGMQKTRLLLHPGETIRTPRILLLKWKGDMADAHNIWRRLLQAYYSPKDQSGKTLTLPISWGTWGTELAEAKLAAIRACRERKLPVEVYWIDAGWYGNLAPKPGQTIDPQSDWSSRRGSWETSKLCYPQGLKSVSDAAKDAGMGFLLWLEPECVVGGSTINAEHRDWTYPKAGGLNLGNPKARKGITDLVSGLVTETGMTWYRQDANSGLERTWYFNDSPDRIGMAEIGHVTGLYAFWDELRARHPGLQIDNCASGGRRLDLETISRSAALWRSDATVSPSLVPEEVQFHTQALAPWIPLTAGVWVPMNGRTPPGLNSAVQVYALRSSYCAGLVLHTFNTDKPLEEWIKPGLEEFQEVRPFFYGDFYPLLENSLSHGAWAAWQYYRPDLKAGIALFFRRTESPLTGIDMRGLRGLDLAATYAVEIRSGMERGEVRLMTGKELKNLRISIPDMPGSALLFYRRQ